MSSGYIGGNPELMLDHMRKLARTISDFPDPAGLAQSRGAGAGAAEGFHAELQALSRDLRAIGIRTLGDLDQIDQKVRDAARQLEETDATAADIANELSAHIAAVTTPSQPVTSPPASSQARATADVAPEQSAASTKRTFG